MADALRSARLIKPPDASEKRPTAEVRTSTRLATVAKSVEVFLRVDKPDTCCYSDPNYQPPPALLLWANSTKITELQIPYPHSFDTGTNDAAFNLDKYMHQGLNDIRVTGQSHGFPFVDLAGVLHWSHVSICSFRLVIDGAPVAQRVWDAVAIGQMDLDFDETMTIDFANQ